MKAMPLAVDVKEAAEMFRLKPDQFTKLVQDGALPRPRRIGPYERWAVADLNAILNGKLARPAPEDFDL